LKVKPFVSQLPFGSQALSTAMLFTAKNSVKVWSRRPLRGGSHLASSVCWERELLVLIAWVEGGEVGLAVTYVVVDVCQSGNVEAVVVRPLLGVWLRAIVADIRTIVDLKIVGLVEDRVAEPLPLLLDRINKGGVSSIASQLCAEEEEAAVGCDVLVVVAVVESEHLPSKAAAAVVVPAVGLTVEDRLCHGGP
jgi:hypothetical protein